MPTAVSELTKYVVSWLRLLPLRLGLILRECSAGRLTLYRASFLSVTVPRLDVSSVPFSRWFSKHLVDRQLIAPFPVLCAPCDALSYWVTRQPCIADVSVRHRLPTSECDSAMFRPAPNLRRNLPMNLLIERGGEFIGVSVTGRPGGEEGLKI